MITLNQTKQWLKQSHHPMANQLFMLLKALRGFTLPAPKLVVAPLYHSYVMLINVWHGVTRYVIWTPLLKGRLEKVGKRLYLYGGLPYITGPVTINIGDDCRVSGQTTISGRTSTQQPRLEIGNNVDLGWMTTVAVGTYIKIGNHVRIAGRSLLAGYPGHPLNAADRAAGLAESDSQVGAIILEDNVWLATGVYVMAGVRIGENTVVAAGSIVTRDLPANTLCAGSPAKVIRQLNTEHGGNRYDA